MPSNSNCQFCGQDDIPSWVSKTWRVWPDRFFLPFPRPLPHAHAQSGKNGLVHETTQHLGLTCSRKRTLFASTVLAAVITVTAKYLSFVGGQGWPAICLQSRAMRPWPRPLALAQEASWARTTPPLFDFFFFCVQS